MKFKNNKSNNNSDKSKSSFDGKNKQVDSLASIDQDSSKEAVKDDPKPIDSIVGKDQGLDALNKVASDIASASHKSFPKQSTNKNDGNRPSHDSFTRNHSNPHKDKFNDGKKRDNDHGKSKPLEPAKVMKTNEPIKIALGEFLQTRVDRTVNEYTEPNAQQLSLIGSTLAANGINWQLVNDIRNLNYANAMGSASHDGAQANSLNLTENVLNTNRAVHSINQVLFTHHCYPIGGAKLFDNAFTQSFATTAQRARETNCSILNYRYAMSYRVDPSKQQGFINSFYPYTSLPGNVSVNMPLLPHQIDDIMLFSLDGGAFLKATNHLIETKPDALFSVVSSNSCYLLPGIPGFNHYESKDDINSGLLTATHNDATKYVDRQYIYDGNSFTTGHTQWAAITADKIPALSELGNSIVHFRYDWTDIWNDLKAITQRPVNKDVCEENFMTYPDYNYTVIQTDFQKLFRALRALTQAASVDSEITQLSGMTDEQAFYNAVQSAIHFGTFMRCLLYGFGKTYKNGAFIKAKVGQLCYNDGLLRNINPERFKFGISFFTTLATAVLPDLPYNKYSFDNFKIWFDLSMSSKDKDPFDENNPVYGLRAIFCGMSEIMNFAVKEHDTSSTRIKNYTPADQIAQVNSSIGSKFESLFSTVDNQWGFRVKSLSKTTTLFVPHGDSLANFFARFPDLFVNRPWIARGKTFAIGDSLTTMLDPANITGFLGNFISHTDLITEMTQWCISYVGLVRDFYNLVESIGANSATIHFDKNVEWDCPSFSPQLIVPGYKQHIVDYFQNTPRMFRFNLSTHGTAESLILNLGAGGTVVSFSGHRPTLGFTPPRASIFQESPDTPGATLAHVSTPRLGFELPKNSSYYDFGTAGTQMYNVSNPWATAARPYFDNPIASSAANLSAHIRSMLQNNAQSGFYLSGDDIDEPFDLYQMFWYPSTWHLPYYSKKHTYITPAYEYPLEPSLNQSGFNETSWNNGAQVDWGEASLSHMMGMQKFAYDYIDDVMIEDKISREYREVFAVRRGTFDAGTLEQAATSLRLTYGSGNTNLVHDVQYVVPNIPGYSGRDVLSTRQNTISIFTAFNIQCFGLPTTRNNIEYSQSLGGEPLYRDVIFDNFSKSLGITYQPFLSVSKGASLWFDQVMTRVPGFAVKAYSSDIDLSTKFFNLLSNVTLLQSGQFDGEAYPSSDGWGVDQLTYPDKVKENEWYKSFIEKLGNYQKSKYNQ